mgnify:CR=1 FL=1
MTAYDISEISNLYQTAQESYIQGKFEEALQYCNKALLQFEAVKNPSSDVQFRLLRLILAIANNGWRGLNILPGGLMVRDLFERAEAVAQQSQAKARIAQILQMKGIWLLATIGASNAIETLQDAWRLARASDDRLTEFITTYSLGHQVSKDNLDNGIALLYRAHEIYSIYEQEIITSDPSPEMIESRLYAVAALGINEFDRGNYSKAFALLRDSLHEYNIRGLKFDLPVILNFLAQVEIASGHFEEAESHLNQAIAQFENSNIPNSWNGNNLALLGKLYIEWGRLENATNPIRRGLQESCTTHNVDLISLVRNYYAEYLMHPGNKQRNLEQAATLLNENLAECRASAMHRSAILALSMLGQIRLQEENCDSAFAFSQEAVEYLEQMGRMPALRSEEIYYNHYKVLNALGNEKEAQKCLKKAYDLIHYVLIDDEKLFFERVPLNRSIIQAYQNHLGR